MATPFEKALRAIDEAHSKDPKTITANGTELPYELHYAQKMTKYLTERQPNASDALKLAIRAQHFRRWEVPRDTYPMTKAGYYSWRTFLKKRQAEEAQKVCLESGLSKADADRVAALIRKEDLRSDEETQVLEDVACLVFLDDQFDEFEKTVDEEKMVVILKKTWAKMTERGHELALNMPLSERGKGLVEQALSSAS
jgi:hypothetical protein